MNFVMHKTIVAMLTVTLAASCLMLILPVGATSTPSTPEFTVKYVDLSYYVPPTYGKDQYTGKTVMTQEGEHIDNRTVEFTIKNQPSPPIPTKMATIPRYTKILQSKGTMETNGLIIPFQINQATFILTSMDKALGDTAIFTHLFPKIFSLKF